MQFRTVGEVLDYVREFHERAARLFRDSARHTRGARVRLLLDWLAQRERELADTLERFEQETHAKVLDSLLQQGPDPTRIPMELPVLHDGMNLDEALDLALKLDEYLERLYRAASDSSNSAQAREFFGDLLTELRAEEAATARTAASVNDF